MKQRAPISGFIVAAAATKDIMRCMTTRKLIASIIGSAFILPSIS
jgi:hypothetical protein